MMTEIPVMMNISEADMMVLADAAENDDCPELKDFACRMLRAVKESSVQLRNTIEKMDLMNPFSMERIG